jgi:hypothetical protein
MIIYQYNKLKIQNGQLSNPLQERPPLAVAGKASRLTTPAMFDSLGAITHMTTHNR